MSGSQNQHGKEPKKPSKWPQITELTEEKAIEEVQRLEDDNPELAQKNYQLIVNTRKFEIENFWKRTIYFWGTLAGVILGYFGLITEGKQQYAIFIAEIGLFYNIIFSLSLRGSKYWQEHWERVAVIYEKALGFRVFSWQLKETLANDYQGEGIFRPKRFSVSKLTMVLGDFTILFWIGLIISDLNWLLTEDKEHRFELHFHEHTVWSPYAIFLWVFTSIGVVIVCYFLAKNYRKYTCKPNEKNQWLFIVLLKNRIRKFKKFLRKKFLPMKYGLNYLRAKMGINRYLIVTDKKIYLIKVKDNVWTCKLKNATAYRDYHNMEVNVKKGAGKNVSYTWHEPKKWWKPKPYFLLTIEKYEDDSHAKNYKLMQDILLYFEDVIK